VLLFLWLHEGIRITVIWQRRFGVLRWDKISFTAIQNLPKIYSIDLLFYSSIIKYKVYKNIINPYKAQSEAFVDLIQKEKSWWMLIRSLALCWIN